MSGIRKGKSGQENLESNKEFLNEPDSTFVLFRGKDLFDLNCFLNI